MFKNRIKRMFNAFVKYLEFNKKTIIVNFVIFFSIFIVALLIDLLTKQFLFQWKNEGGIDYGVNQDLKDYRFKSWLFGIRSVFHRGLTASFLNSIPLEVIHFFNFIIVFVCIIFLFALKSKWFAVFIGLICAGTIGNMIDRFLFLGVRDILFLPWLDRGTFNFADVEAIFGTLGSIITLIILLFKNDNGVLIKR